MFYEVTKFQLKMIAAVKVTLTMFLMLSSKILSSYGPTSGTAVTLKIGRREVPGSNRGRVNTG